MMIDSTCGMVDSNPEGWTSKELSPGVKRVWAEWDALAEDLSLSEDELIVALFRAVSDHADEMSVAELAEFQNDAAGLLYHFRKELAAPSAAGVKYKYR